MLPHMSLLIWAIWLVFFEILFPFWPFLCCGVKRYLLGFWHYNIRGDVNFIIDGYFSICLGNLLVWYKPRPLHL